MASGGDEDRTGSWGWRPSDGIAVLLGEAWLLGFPLCEDPGGQAKESADRGWSCGSFEPAPSRVCCASGPVWAVLCQRLRTKAETGSHPRACWHLSVPQLQGPSSFPEMDSVVAHVMAQETEAQRDEASAPCPSGKATRIKSVQLPCLCPGLTRGVPPGYPRGGGVRGCALDVQMAYRGRAHWPWPWPLWGDGS